MKDYARYLTWLAIGRCQICGQDTGGNDRDMCISCEEEINAQAEAEQVA